MGSRKLETLMDLVRANRVCLIAVCEDCGHRAALDKAGLAPRYALSVSLFALRRKLRCRQCGERLASWAIE